ncbi:hypothetical protein F7D14_10290 [Methylocystis parvus]|uniref:Uncharacterized protein n=1 Tax=Methylocystis parvus TaxID=134 RepID=A0A6B8LZF7_9HYPH|nr:hypothetical protein F7D14_10290 [Methylocystis parvus]
MRKLRQEFSQSAQREKILAPRPFCQEPASLSVGILNWPRPGVARRDRSSDLRLRRQPLRFDA